MALTIGRLARKFNLSRSTLLYYDSIGLLSPSARGNGRYRLYSKKDCERLEQIAVYRQAGLPLRKIIDILDGEQCLAAASLEAKLEEINREIKTLRQQQQFIIQFLQNSRLLERITTIQKDELVDLLQSAGLDEAAQWKFHNEFEKKFSEKHEDFLQLLGLNTEQISQIREWSRKEGCQD